MNELALFAGAGGGILGGKLLGWKTVCAVEIDQYARRILMQRQNDGCLDPFPIWDDVRTFDGKSWRGLVDVVSGGFPCQDISAAGKGAGIDGARSGLWSEMARIIGEVGPQYVFVENSPNLTSRGLGRVLGDLASMGYDARWGVLGAVHAGAPHKRERIWIVAHTNSLRQLQQKGSKQDQWGRIGNRGATLSDTMRKRGQVSAGWEFTTVAQSWGNSEARSFGAIAREWWATEPDVGRVADGVAFRVDRLRAIGNGQVPAVVALAWEILGENA